MHKKIALVMIVTLVALAAFVLVGCGGSAPKSAFAQKLDELNSAYTAFEKVLEGKDTIDEAKATEEYTKLAKIREEVTQLKASAKMTDEESVKLAMLEGLISLVVDQ